MLLMTPELDANYWSCAETHWPFEDALGGKKRRAESNLAEAIRRRFLPLGGADELEPHPPVSVRAPPRFDR
jgi:hypothetical protein